MAVTILFFASIRERLSQDRETLPWPAPDSVANLIDQLASRGGAWTDVFAGPRPVLVAINEVLTSKEQLIHDGDTIAFFPPVTGG